MKKGFLLILSLLFLFLMAACGGNQEASKEEQQEDSTTKADSNETIKIGAVLSASGGAAPLGKPEMDTVKMLADEINSNGGINGAKIELIAYDDKSDQNEAVLSMKKLLDQDKVVAVVGGTTSGNSLAMIPLAEEAQIPFVSLGASKQVNAPSDGSPCEWTFKSTQGDDIVVPKALEYLKNQGLTKVAWLNVANSFGTSGHEEFSKLVEEYGIEVVAEEEFEATVTDAKAMLTRVKKADPQAIIIWGTAQESAVVTKNIRQLGIEVPIIESHGIATKQFIELAGEAANGVVFPAGKLLIVDQLPDSDPQKEIITAYKEKFESKYDYAASTFGGHAWDGFQMIVHAIKESGADPAAMKESLENIKEFVGISGIYNLTPEDHNGLGTKALVMVEIVDGEYKIKE